MKRVLTILMVVLVSALRAVGQLTSIGGSASYSQEYQETSIGNQLSLIRYRSPSLDLETAGSILSPMIAEFSLQTYLSGNFMNANSAASALDYRLMNLNIYNLNLSLFQFSPAWIVFRARDGIVSSRTVYDSTGEHLGKTRSRGEDLTLSLRRIFFLPTLTLSYGNASSFALEGEPSDLRTRTYTFSTAATNGSSSFNASGTTTETENLLDGSLTKISNIHLSGGKVFNEFHSLSLQSDYNWFDEVGLFSSTLTYTGTLSDVLRLNADAGLGQSSGPASSSSVVTAASNLNFTPNAEWRYNFSVSSSRRQTLELAAAGNSRLNLNSASSGFTVDHRKATAFGLLSNSITLGISRDVNDGMRTTTSGGFGNSLNTSMGGTVVGIGQNTNLSLTREGGAQQFRIGNRLSLSADSRLLGRIANRADLMYSENRSAGSLEIPVSYRSAGLIEALQGNFNSVIPFSLMAAFSATRYLQGLVGTAYGWNGTFASGRFFVDNLSARYQYGRSYDINYQRESIDQSLHFGYGFRQFTAGLTLHERRMISRQRDAQITVSRSF